MLQGARKVTLVCARGTHSDPGVHAARVQLKSVLVACVSCIVLLLLGVAHALADGFLQKLASAGARISQACSRKLRSPEPRRP